MDAWVDDCVDVVPVRWCASVEWCGFVTVRDGLAEVSLVVVAVVLEYVRRGVLGAESD